MADIYSANDVLHHGLLNAGISEDSQNGMGPAVCREIFRSLHGSPPEVCAEMWQDMCDSDVDSVRIPEGERGWKSMRLFLIAHHELWAYPKNRRIIQVLFHPIGEKDTYGKNLWEWIGRICALLPTKIRWQDRFDDPEAEIFVVTVDGVDCRTHEKRDHPLFPFDKQRHSHKFAGAALKYEIAVAIYSNHIVWVNGPFKGGKHDLTILREGQGDGSGSLLDMIPQGKLLVTDRGYKTGKEDEMRKIAYKRDDDPIELKRFKGRVTCRHETVNSKIKQFECVSQIFRHGEEKHEMAFKAVCVIVQYHLDMGVATLYEI